MASLVLSGDTSGTITLAAPDVAGSTTQTLVATTGILAPLVSGTAQASTSGTSIEFTSIPSWVKRITVLFSGVSTDSTGQQQIQLGDSGGYEITDYVGTGANNATGASPVVTNCTTGFALNSTSVAAQTQQGIATICLVGSNTWVFSWVGGRNNTVDLRGAGTKTLSGTLTQIRVIGSATGSPSDNFDAGTINILYE
jgi:hypothetical protein